MSPAPRKARLAAQSLWDRPEPALRPSPAPLSRERIVAAALALADAQGLAAVSMRNVAAALDAGPMRLYGYVATKEELLSLMVDAVYGEMHADGGTATDDWRETLGRRARQLHRAAGLHPWFADLLGGRPSQGPNALTFLETGLAALMRDPGFAHVDLAMRALKTLKAYVIGAIRSEAGERNAEAESGLDRATWQKAHGEYLQRMIATGRFPNVARLMREATHPAPEQMFELGLQSVLDGIAALRR